MLQIVIQILIVLNLLKTISTLAVSCNNFFFGTFLRAGHLSFLPLSVTSAISIAMAPHLHLDYQPAFWLPFPGKCFSCLLLRDQAKPQHFLPLLLWHCHSQLPSTQYFLVSGYYYYYYYYCYYYDHHHHHIFIKLVLILCGYVRYFFVKLLSSFIIHVHGMYTILLLLISAILVSCSL